MRALRWLNAGFLILAACRALVPGLCATQTAALEQAKQHAVHACCQARTAEAQHDERPRIGTPIPPHADCALCSLMQGMLESLKPCQVIPPHRAVVAVSELPPSLVAAPALRAHYGRAPPILG